MSSYTSKDIKTLEGIEGIRENVGMYIGTVDQDGIHHLVLEVISNSIDEFLNGYGDEVKIKINKDLINIEDNGRGIPFGKTKKGGEALKEIITNLHSGGKFGQGGYSVSGGLHGIGLTAVNALSQNFTIISKRDKKRAIIKAEKGIIKEFKVEDDFKQKQSGTSIIFSPDPDIFKNINVDKNYIKKMVKELSYLTSGLKFIFNDEVFLSKYGLKEMIKEKVKEPITNVIYIKGEEQGFMVEVAFQFTDSRNEKIYAFTNNIPNRDGGTHITGFKTAFTNSINKLARQYGFLNEKDSNLNGDLLRNGIVAAVSVKMTERPVFKSQTKDKLMTPGARTAVSKLITANFEKSINKKDLKIIVDRAIIEEKALSAAKRAREAAAKVKSGGKNMNAIKDLPSKLVDCRDRNGEIWILEGK